MKTESGTGAEPLNRSKMHIVELLIRQESHVKNQVLYYPTENKGNSISTHFTR